MTSHLGLMVVFAACVAAVFGTLMREDSREQWRLGARIFGGLVAAAFALGLLMYAGFR